MTDQRATGIALEDMIHTAVSLMAARCRREQEIRTEFGDASLNGIDHWIQHGGTHILVQDKWRETTTQPEISQFLTCAERLQARISDPDAKVILLWVAKREPTSHAMRLLQEKGVAVLCCGTSPQNLAKLVVLEIAAFLDIDPTTALRSIPVVPATPMLHVGGAAPKYDDSDAGKAERTAIEGIMTQIHTQLIQRLMWGHNMNGGALEIRTILEHHLPQAPDAWMGMKKIDYGQMLRSLAKVCVPTKTRPTQSRSYFLYTKARYMSQAPEAMRLCKEYIARRDTMVRAKSEWARSLPTIKWEPEPMLDDEFRKTVLLCSDGMSHYMSGTQVQKRSSGFEYQFWQHYNGN
jgi:hypothetical protein